ncbi:unnamed protein product, partial [Nesidiocoris tenuis]
MDLSRRWVDPLAHGHKYQPPHKDKICTKNLMYQLSRASSRKLELILPTEGRQWRG